MKQKLTGLFWLLMAFLFGYLLNGFVVSSFFVEALEKNRISIYFIKDCVFVFAVFIFLAFLAYHLVTKYILKCETEKNKYNWFLYIILAVSIFRFVLLENYPNVPRQEIGYFYMIPEGQSITYPKYPRSIKSKN